MDYTLLPGQLACLAAALIADDHVAQASGTAAQAARTQALALQKEDLRPAAGGGVMT